MAASAFKNIINFGKGLGKQIGKVKPVKKVGDYIKRTAQEGSKKTVTPKPKPKVTPKVKVKEPISKKQFKKRGTAKGSKRKSPYGTKGTTKGYAAYRSAFNKANKTGKTGKTGKTTGKTTGKATGKKSVLDRNINPFAGKRTIRGAGQTIGSAINFVRKNPGTSALYGLGTHYAGKQLGLWGRDKVNTPEVIKPKYDDYYPTNKVKNIERDGGSVRRAPGMKGGGGLRWVNGKWVR